MILKRYDIYPVDRQVGNQVEAEAGRFVLYTDVGPLQQRLADAEKLLRGLKQNGLHAFNMSTGLSVQDNIDAFLASPGCADGE